MIPSLSQRSSTGAFWVAGSLVGQHGIQLASKIVLARLLTPAEFGLVGMASVILFTLSIFMNLGFASALVYRRDRVEDAAHTAFWILPLNGMALAGIGWAAAVPVAAFFGMPEVVPLARVLCVSFVAASLAWVPSAMITRAFQFKKSFAAEVTNAAVYGAVAIPLALRGHGAMSLAWGWLAGSVAQSAMYFVLSPYRPRFVFHRELVPELFSFGGAVMSSGVAAHLVRQTDVVVVGRMLGSAPLGIYSLALQLVSLVVTQVVAVVRRVAFPAFAEVQHEPERLRRAAASALHLAAALVFPAVVGAGWVAPWLVPAVFGDRWAAAVPVVGWLVPMGLFFGVQHVIGTLLHGVGLPHVYQRIPWVQFALLVVLAVPAGAAWGARGIAAAVSLTHAAAFAMSVETVHRRLGWRRTDLLAPMARPAAATAVMAAALAALHLWPLSPVAGGVFGVAGGMVVYGGALLALDRAGIGRILRWVRSSGDGGGLEVPVPGPAGSPEEMPR
jgi:O-antigen/teichoic acid export membrane protein